MYMPSQIEVSYGAGYKDETIGPLADSVLEAFAAYTNKNASGNKPSMCRAPMQIHGEKFSVLR